MAKQSGLGSNLYVAEYDISGDVGAVNSTSTPRGVLDITGIDKSAMERILGRKDGSISFTSFWNTAAGRAHPVISALPTTDRIVSVFIGPLTSVGGAAASMTAKVVDYAPSFADDGSLTATTNAQANGTPLEWGESLTTGLQSFATGTVNGTSIDLGSTSTLFGAAAYLHCTVMPSGTLTVTVEDSANDSSFAAVTGMTFTNLTAPGSERVQGTTSATVRRYVRVTCSGTHGTASVAVNFVRYLVDPNT